MSTGPGRLGSERWETPRKVWLRVTHTVQWASPSPREQAQPIQDHRSREPQGGREFRVPEKDQNTDGRSTEEKEGGGRP